MKRLVFCIACMITSYALPAQDTSEKIYNCKVLKRGFYKTYTDFINNAPSITGKFVVTQTTDSPVVAASYQLTDSLMVFDKIWGFCDGTSVFIRYPQSYINDKYFWKILELKKYSTFNYRYKNITVVTLLTTPLTAITTAAISGTASALTAKKNYEELIIDKKGKIKSLSIGQLKEWLKPYPDLYIPFRKEIAALHLPKNYNDDEAVSPETYAKEIAIMQLYFLYLNEK